MKFPIVVLQLLLTSLGTVFVHANAPPRYNDKSLFTEVGHLLTEFETENYEFFKKEIYGSSKPWVLIFYANWCSYSVSFAEKMVKILRMAERSSKRDLLNQLNIGVIDCGFLEEYKDHDKDFGKKYWFICGQHGRTVKNGKGGNWYPTIKVVKSHTPKSKSSLLNLQKTSVHRAKVTYSWLQGLVDVRHREKNVHRNEENSRGSTETTHTSTSTSQDKDRRTQAGPKVSPRPKPKPRPRPRPKPTSPERRPTSPNTPTSTAGQQPTDLPTSDTEHRNRQPSSSQKTNTATAVNENELGTLQPGQAQVELLKDKIILIALIVASVNIMIVGFVFAMRKVAQRM